MNKGIIYKIEVDEIVRYYIKLERTVKIKDTEYNIFVDDTNFSKPNAELVSIEEYFTCGLDLSVYLGKKLDFDIVVKQDKKNGFAIKSVEYYEA